MIGSMKNFTKLAEGIDVSGVKAALDINYAMWDKYTIRQEFEGSPHVDTETIYIRGPEKLDREFYQGQTAAQPYPLPDDLALQLNLLFFNVLTSIQPKELGYAMLVSLHPKSRVQRHRDEGRYAEHYQRFHLPIYSTKGNIFFCGDESVQMKEGELWTFNHQLEHSVNNNSKHERIHLIFDAVL
mgnify:FL=1